MISGRNPIALTFLWLVTSCGHIPEKNHHLPPIPAPVQEIAIESAQVSNSADSLQQEREVAPVELVADQRPQSTISKNLGERFPAVETVAPSVAPKAPTPARAQVPGAAAASFIVLDQSIPLVPYWLKFYRKRNLKRLQRHLKNATRYRAVVEKIFESLNLPKDLYYVGLIESGYHLGAKSWAGAVGPWQLMKGTARYYGLRVDRYIDERRNLIKSTYAAGKYLQDLYNIFGSWHLALASYNAGEYRILNIIKKANSRKWKTLIEKGYLPKETRSYIPKLIAVKLIDSDHQRYGIKIAPPLPPFTIHPSFTLQSVKKVKTLARLAKLGRREFLAHNPEVRGSVIPASRRQPLQLRLPQQNHQFLSLALPQGGDKGQSKNFPSTLKLAKRPPPKLQRGSKQWIRYRVKRGENLGSLARRFHTKVATLRVKNNLKGNAINADQWILVPSASQSVYVVRRGDSLISIANRFGVKLRSIIHANSLRGQKIFPNQKLIIPGHS